MTIYYVVIAGLVVWTLQALSAMESQPAGATGSEPSTKRRWPIIFWMLLLALLAGLRHEVGTDYRAYRWLYTTYVDAGTAGLSALQEPMLPLIALISHGLGWDYLGMFFIASVLTVGISLAVLGRWTHFTALAFLLFVLSSNWQGSFNGVRQYLAAALVLMAAVFLTQNRRVGFVGLILLASMAHVTAILCLAFALIPRRRPHPMALLAVTIVMIGLATQIDLLLGYFDYVRTEVREQGSLMGGVYVTERVSALRVVFPVVPILLLLPLAETSRLTEFEWFALNMTFVNAGILAASLNSAYAARFAIYSAVFACVAIPALVSRTQPRDRTIITLLFVAAYATFWWFDTRAQSTFLEWNFIPTLS